MRKWMHPKLKENATMTSYEIEFSAKELSYFLFREKRCPSCEELLQRAELGKGYIGSANKLGIYYRCSTCNETYSLTDLSEKGKPDTDTSRG
ncbi:hypothetical protein [Paenibacillus thiaminolyticus]|uniref:hypothetical protein n=1 Tax=Paenibacillus thiaminolyticus TaxID=49283 RepID=UPI0025433A2B|nr:hypothetical protein [Paenibacillus thiaminolyticus]WII37412.1 hypothetical protein O0V01_28175 [Paenibacillus thiaminolyticus]